jgi:hypothetical protein
MVNNMKYQFVRTSQGPVVQGEDEILFFSDFQALIDYLDEDSDFVAKAKEFVAEGLRAVSANIADGLTAAIVGGDQTPALYGYLNAIRSLREFEHQFLPHALGTHRH